MQALALPNTDSLNRLIESQASHRRSLPKAHFEVPQIDEGKAQHLELNALLRHLLSIRRVVEIENRLGTLRGGDITPFVDAIVPDAVERIGDITEGHNLDVENRLFEQGFLYTCLAHEGPRLYITNQQYLDLT